MQKKNKRGGRWKNKYRHHSPPPSNLPTSQVLVERSPGTTPLPLENGIATFRFTPTPRFVNTAVSGVGEPRVRVEGYGVGL